MGGARWELLFSTFKTLHGETKFLEIRPHDASCEMEFDDNGPVTL